MLTSQSKSFSEKDICVLSEILFKLDSAAVKITNEKESQLAAKCEQLFTQVIQQVLKDKDVNYGIEDKEMGLFIFKEVLQSVQSDAQEEIVGQERPPHAIPRMMERKIKNENENIGPSGKNLNSITRIAAAIYPLALLVATYDKKAKVPSTRDEGLELIKDKDQFEREVISQFGDNASNWSKEFFGNCLKSIWGNKRGNEFKRPSIPIKRIRKE